MYEHIRDMFIKNCMYITHMYAGYIYKLIYGST